MAPPIPVKAVPKELVTVSVNDHPPSLPPPHDAVNLAINPNPPPADPDDAALKCAKTIKILKANYLAVKIR